MKIFALHNNSGSRFYRLIPQLKALQKLGHEVIIEPHNEEHIQANIDWADVVIFQMVFSVEWTRYAKEKGKKVIFECDDFIHKVPEGHYSYKELSGWGRWKWLWTTWRVLRLCDAFISTCENLNRQYGWMAKKSFVFDNYLDLEHWLKEPRPNLTGRVRILWAGSTSHTPDLEWIKPVIDKILKKYPNTQFIYIGHGGIKSTDPQAQFIYGEDTFEGLPDSREAMLSYPPNVWPYVLASLGADIAIAPLVKNDFNAHKSQCKYLEYAVNRLPGVYSKWFYTKVRHGETGYLAETPEEWESYLSLLIDSVIIRTRVGEAAYEDAITNHDIRKYVGGWTSIVESIAQ